MDVNDYLFEIFGGGIFYRFSICFIFSFGFLYLTLRKEESRVNNSILSSLLGVLLTSIFWVVDFDLYVSIVSSIVFSVLFYRRLFY